MFRCGLLDLAVVCRLEARVGIEPTYRGFADPLLATPSLSNSTHVPITINFGPVFVRVTVPPRVPCAARKTAPGRPKPEQQQGHCDLERWVKLNLVESTMAQIERFCVRCRTRIPEKRVGRGLLLLWRMRAA